MEGNKESLEFIKDDPKVGDNNRSPERMEGETQTQDNEKRLEFIREQYAQYWEMLRLHSGFSWQIPATGIVAIIAFIVLDPEKLEGWAKTPIVPALAFLAVGMFTFIMLIHHQRNLLFVKYYERAIARLEQDYGLEMEVHHLQITPKLSGWRAISSSSSLSIFLLLLTIGSLSTSFYFLLLAF